MISKQLAKTKNNNNSSESEIIYQTICFMSPKKKRRSKAKKWSNAVKRLFFFFGGGDIFTNSPSPSPSVLTPLSHKQIYHFHNNCYVINKLLRHQYLIVWINSYVITIPNRGKTKEVSCHFQSFAFISLFSFPNMDLIGCFS